jgi:hypothetical protein
MQLNKNAVYKVLGFSLCIFCVSFAAGVASAADTALSNYQQDRAACMDGRSTQDRATCLRDAGAALNEARHGKLKDDDASVYQKNAQIRCNALPDADRPDCIRRMSGQDTTVSGSVSGGGVLRETTTIHVDPPPPAPAEPMYPNTPAGTPPRY